MRRFAAQLLLLFTLVTPASAQPPKAAQDEFVPVNAPISAQDTIPAPRLVGIAYGFIWVVLFGYVWSIKNRLSHVEQEIDAVSHRVATRK